MTPAPPVTGMQVIPVARGLQTLDPRVTIHAVTAIQPALPI